MEPERLARATLAPSPRMPHPSPSPAPPWITENTEMLAELALLSSTQPNPAYSSTSSAVQSMLTLDDFEAALERARKHNRLVVIKFYQVARALEPLRSHPHIRTRLRFGPPPEPEPVPVPEPGALQGLPERARGVREGRQGAAGRARRLLRGGPKRRASSVHPRQGSAPAGLRG